MINILVFGTGRMYELHKYKFTGMKIVAFLDNDKKKQGTFLDGYKIDCPENIHQYQYDYIVLLSIYYEQMREQLLQMGVNEQCIIDKKHRGIFSDVCSVIKYEVWDQSRIKERNKGKIVLVTHEMTMTGAPLMLYNMACILKKKGYLVEVFTKVNGELVTEFIKAGIGVSIFEHLKFSKEQMRYYLNGVDMVIVNTVRMHDFIKRLEGLTVSVIWWIHEEDYLYKQFKIQKSDLIVADNVHIYGVGERAVDTYVKYSDGEKIEELIYGIEEVRQGEKTKNKDSKLIFAIIGMVGRHKAQDVFLEAVKENWTNWKDKAEFWMIGRITEQDKCFYEEHGMIKVFGNVSHEEMLKLYADIDVIVCPSRNDTMPVVLAEGMMNKRVCIASDATGTAAFIEPYENGLICNAGDSKSLAEQIQWVLEHRAQLSKLGGKAYETFKNRFAIEIFEEKVSMILDTYIMQRSDD